MVAIHHLSAELASVASAAIVYVEEAHAVDEWPISSGRYNGGRGAVCVRQPRTRAERVALARQMVTDFNVTLPVLVDAPEDGNPFEKAYAPWPLRLYVIHGGKMRYIAEPEECTYSLADLRTFVARWGTVGIRVFMSCG